MRGTRTLQAILGVLVVGAVLAVASVAGAQGTLENDEYSGVISATISNPTPGVSCNNTGIVITVDHLQPGSTATFILVTPNGEVVLGTAVADANGRATLTFDLPPGTPVGQHTIIVRGINNYGVADEVRLTINVVDCDHRPPPTTPPTTPGTPPGGGGLVRTGTDLGAPLRIGMVVLAAGAALLLVSRKRTARS